MHLFLTVVLCCSRIGDNSITTDWNAQLAMDHSLLKSRSEQMDSYPIPEEEFKQLFREGIEESLMFYLSPERPKAAEVHDLIVTQLVDNSGLRHPLERPGIQTTTRTRAFEAFDRFSGRWHGTWKAQRVHHLWLPTRKIKMEVWDGYQLIGFQTCFTGDGFGWNYVVQKNDTIIILGFVYHVNDTGQIITKNPHYAFLNSNNQLSWVSDDHIYYEFVHSGSHSTDPRCYIITGGPYQKFQGKLTLTSGFQTIYFPDRLEPSAFTSLEIDRPVTTDISFPKRITKVFRQSKQVQQWDLGNSVAKYALHYLKLLTKASEFFP